MHQIFISVGETSGDMYAAAIIKQLPATSSVYGNGGEQMETAGCQLLFNVVNHSTIGFIEPLIFLLLLSFHTIPVQNCTAPTRRFLGEKTFQKENLPNRNRTSDPQISSVETYRNFYSLLLYQLSYRETYTASALILYKVSYFVPLSYL